LCCSSEIKLEDVVVEVICRKEPIESTHGQSRSFCQDLINGIPGNKRHLITLCVIVRLVACELSMSTVSLVHKTWILHLHIRGGLEIYIPASQHPLKECLQLFPSVRCRHPPMSGGDGDSELRRQKSSTESPTTRHNEWQRNLR
jgi:hypothetical protein